VDPRFTRAMDISPGPACATQQRDHVQHARCFYTPFLGPSTIEPAVVYTKRPPLMDSPSAFVKPHAMLISHHHDPTQGARSLMPGHAARQIHSCYRYAPHHPNFIAKSTPCVPVLGAMLPSIRRLPSFISSCVGLSFFESEVYCGVSGEWPMDMPTRTYIAR